MSYTPTVVFDFDGVIHSYKSGWQGAGVIPDPAVPGIDKVIASLREAGYKVVVVSTRCSSPEGMGAVRRFLRDNEIVVDDVMAEKPPALCYVDDRAIRFDGDTETLVQKITSFHSWTEGKAVERNDKPVEGLRKCKAAFYKGGELHWVEGWFHRWASNYEEFDAICGNYTEAIVELEDGQIVTCVMDTVKFLDREERR